MTSRNRPSVTKSIFAKKRPGRRTTCRILSRRGFRKLYKAILVEKPYLTWL